MLTLHKFFCAVLLLVFSCGAAVSAEATLNKIAAVVNGEMITLHTLRNHTNAELARQKISADDPRVPQLMRQILDAMISDILLRQEAKRWKVTVSDSEVDAEIKNILKNNRLTQTAFEAQLAQQGTNLDLLKERIRDSFLRKKMISLMISRKVVITKDEIAAYYEENKAQFSGQRYADFSVIVFNPSVKAQGIYDQLKSGSIPFDDAARQYSIDRTSQNGGYVGRVPWSNIPPGLQSVLSTTPEGGLTPLITSDGKTVVFRLNSMGEGNVVSLEEASDRIEETLKEPRLQERFNEYTQQLRSKAVVDIRI